MWHHICAKSLLWRQMLRKSLLENAFGTKYVQNRYFEGKYSRKSVTLKWIWHQHMYKIIVTLKANAQENRYLKMCLTQNMYKNITLKANAKEHHYLKMHVAPYLCKTMTLKANATEIVTWKCIWHHICTKSLLWRQMPRKSCHFKMCLTPTYV